jgi:dienelactone hydrolase
MKESARELCGIGYVVLALDLEVSRQHSLGKPQGPGAALGDERALAQMSAAVRWLRRRADVLPDRIGVVGWSWGAGQALALAASTPVQACVLCDGPVASDPALIAGLHRTAILGLFAGKDPQTRQTLPALRKALASAATVHQFHIYEGVDKGFMQPVNPTYAEHAAERAWVELYEFLAKHVEDAPVSPLPAAVTAKPITTIADLMRAVNGPIGVRGNLIELLAKDPADAEQWAQVRARAALIAEAGRWLQARTPPKGSHRHWLQEARAFTATAETIVASADRRDLDAARGGLQQLASHCAVCHREHR